MKTNPYRFSDGILICVLTFLLAMLMLAAYFYLAATIDMLLVLLAAFMSAVIVKFRVLERQLAELKASIQKKGDGE